jgi:tetratricopeptide (TPR) repeat protein
MPTGRVWHHALAALTADENVAAALEAAARRSQLRGGHASAATAFERAAGLSEAEPSRIRRFGEAAQAAWAAGQADRARDLVTHSLPHTDGPQRVRLLYLSGLIEGQSGWLPDALGPLLEAIESSEDVSLTLEMVREAYECATYAEVNDQLAQLCRRAGELQPVTETDRFIAAAVMAWGSELSHDHARGTLLAAEAIERAERLDDPRCLIWAAVTADRQGTWGDGLPHANRAVAVARERGPISVWPRGLAAQSYELIGRSRLEFAYSAAEEGRRLALDIGQPWTASWNVVDLASIEALRGHEEEVRGHVEVLQELVAASGATLLRILSARALGLLDLTLGRPAEALEHLRSFVVAGAGALTSPVAVLGVPDVIEAAVRAHRLDEVVDHLVRFQESCCRRAASGPSSRSTCFRRRGELDTNRHPCSVRTKRSWSSPTLNGTDDCGGSSFTTETTPSTSRRTSSSPSMGSRRRPADCRAAARVTFSNAGPRQRVDELPRATGRSLV